MAKISCIYKISNLINGKIYIGSAADFNKRKSNHLRQLNTNSHHSKYLQNSWNKNGPEIFSFSVLEVVDDINNLLEREQHYLDSLLFAKEKNCKFNNLGYNICRKVGSFTGVKHSEKTKKILSLKNIGKKHSESTRKKMSKSSRRIKGSDHHCYGKKIKEESIIKQKNTFKNNYKKENHPFYNKKIEGDHLIKLKKASEGTNNPMYNNNVLNIWKHKYGEEEAIKRWNKSNEMRSINGKEKGTKKVIQKDINGNIIREYKSMSEASAETKTNINGIRMVCNSERNLAGGFKWEFKK